MRKPVILITGANGEIGQELINTFNKKGGAKILALDLHPLSSAVSEMVGDVVTGNILDQNLLQQLNSEYEISEMYHLAALLSTRAEFSPQMAHQVNVTGTLNMLNLAVEQSKSQSKAVKFFFPSSIAVYGIDDIQTKNLLPPFVENDHCHPQTMYGCNKLYCENLGIYYSRYFQRLAEDFTPGLIDFRSLRFPGLISASTIPSGGTTDFLPQLLHSAAKNKPYVCFVRNDSRIPFMVMPDAIHAIFKLMEAEIEPLSRQAYNIQGFNPSVAEFFKIVKAYFPDFAMTEEVDNKTQSIVDTWPAEVNDEAARTDWNWSPEYDLSSAFDNYLIPALQSQYKR